MFRVKVALWREGADLLPELVAGAQELWLEPQAWLEHIDLAATPKRSVNQEDQQHRAWSDDTGNGSDEETPQETEDHGIDDQDENEGGENDDHYNEHETIETFSKCSGSRKNRRRRLRALSADTEPIHEKTLEIRHQPMQRRHSIGESRAHGKALPENDFWVSEDTTFAELCEDAMRYFLRNKDNASQPKLMGTLVNAHLVAWELHDRVLARLDACPSEKMRQVVLKVSRLRPWEQERQHKAATSGSPSVERSVKRAGASDFSYSSASSSPARANRQVSTLQSPSRGVWRQAPSRKTPLRESIHHNLRGIFAAYSLRGHHAEDGAISLQSFLQFISECRIPIPRERATLIYVSARCKNYDGFLSMLLRLAQVTHGSTCRSELAALEALLNEHIAPHTVRWDTWKTAGCPPESLFLQVEHSTRLQALLESVKPALQHAFDAYCVRDPQASVRKDRTSHERFLTLGQFQLLTQDFDLFAAGTYLDARIASRIYVTCCEHHNRSSSPIGRGHGSSGKMGWPAFLQALVRLAIVLAIPLETGHQGDKDGSTDHARNMAAQRRDRHFAHVALRYPDLALKGLLQQLHFNVFGRPAKLRELCGRLENRHWRRGPVTPLGSQTDIIACAQKLAKVFTPLWDADGGPADYFVLFAEEVREHARSEANATRSMRGPAAGLGRLRGPHNSNEDSGERKETSHFLLMSPSVSTMPSTLASASRESSLPPAATDPTKAMAKYMEEACQQAEEAMLEAAEKFARRAEVCAQITQMERSESAHEAEHAMSDCVQLYKVATLRFRAALRSFDNLSDGEIATTKWRWAVSILGFGLRLQSSCLAGLPSHQQLQQPRRPFAGGWGFCSWEALLQPSARPAKRGPQYVRACASFIELCEFARACVENAEELVTEVSRWRQQQAAARKHAKAGHKSKLNQEQEQGVGQDRGASGDEDNAGDGKGEDGDDEDEELESCVVIDDGPNAHPEILYQLGLDRASAFRLLGSLRMISLRFQLMSPGTRYAGGAAWNSGRFFRAVARSALAADHLFGCSALEYERIRFSKHFRISLLNNWSFVLFERAQVKALAKAALHRAIQLETTQSKAEGRASSTNLVSATRLDRPIQEALARSRQLIGLGFELALPSHANREWLLPVALLWTWTNCIDLAGLTAVSLSVLVAKAVTPRREEADCRSAPMETSASEMHIFALEASEVSRVFTERARLALISLFDSVKTQMAELQDPEALPEQAVRALLRRIFAWDKNEYYIQLVSTAMKAQGIGRLTLAQYLSFMVRLALEDPIGFAKTLYQGDVLQRFEVEDARPTRKVPTSLFIASLLYPSFAESARARRHRRSYIRRLSTTPSPLMFQDDHSAAHHGGALKDQTELVEAAAAVPENSLVDHFVVLDAREFAAPEELRKLSSLAEAQLAPRVRTVWPPTVEGVLEEDDDLARGRFSLEQLAGFRALHEQAPMPLDLVGFCFRKEKYSLMGVRPGASATQTNSSEASVTPMVLTDGMGTRRYAVILTFWEELDPHEALREYNRDGALDHLLATSGSRKWLAPTSLCILSRWPMYQTFETFLRHILRLSRMEVPLRLERYIANFISETPVPPPGTMQVQTILYDSPLYIRMPARSELPLPEVSMARLFASLSVGNILAIFACLLTEQKVALCSVDETKLTPVAEALRALLFPLDLQTIYIPVLPPSLMDFLYAPVPFLMGINSSCLDLGNSAILPAKSLQVQLETDARLARSDSGKSTTAGPLSPVLSAAAAASSLSSSGAAAAGGGLAGGSNTASSALTSAPNSGIVDVRKAPSDARLQSWVSIGGTSGAGPASRFSSRPSLRGRSNSFSTMLHSESVEPSNVDATTIPAAIEPQDVFFVDLDRNVVLTPLQHDATPLALPQLPKASGKKLRETLMKLSRQVPKAETCSAGATECSQGTFDNEDDRKVNARTSAASFASRLPKNAQAILHDKWCHEVRQAFLGFQMRLLRNYKRCIVRKPQEIDWSFDRDAFLADHTSSRDFCKQFLSTQLVAGFVQDAIAVQNGQMHARQHDLDLFDALLGEAENRAKSNRLYSRQKKKPNSPLLDGASPSVSRTHYVPLPGNLKPSQTASGRASDGGPSGPFPPASSFPVLDPTLLGPRDGQSVPLLDVPRVQVPFAKVEISEFKRVASRRNLDPKMAASCR